MDEPLVFTQKNDTFSCVSNVCTHRGKIIIEKAGKCRILRCGYHSRCFRLNGTFKSMPCFEKTENFPTEADNLTNIPFGKYLDMLFVSLNPRISFDDLFRPLKERVGWMPLDNLQFDLTTSKDYYVNANWALYCDNFLEGFHIPYVHPALNAALQTDNYDYELFPYGNLQLGIAKDGQPCFDMPKEAKDFGKQVYAYYFWVFPNMMFNFYPWGLSLNIVTPLSYNQTKISFRTYRFEGTSFDPEQNQLHITELEDEAVVESVQKGIQSRYYQAGRFSPTQEKAVHHFHRLINQFMEATASFGK